MQQPTDQAAAAPPAPADSFPCIRLESSIISDGETHALVVVTAMLEGRISLRYHGEATEADRDVPRLIELAEDRAYARAIAGMRAWTKLFPVLWTGIARVETNLAAEVHGLTRCPDCRQMVRSTEYNRHVAEHRQSPPTAERIWVCGYCHAEVPDKDYQAHIAAHETPPYPQKVTPVDRRDVVIEHDAEGIKRVNHNGQVHERDSAAEVDDLYEHQEPVPLPPSGRRKVEPRQPADPAVQGGASVQQARKIYAVANAVGLQKNTIRGMSVKYHGTTPHHLTSEQANALIEILQKLETDPATAARVEALNKLAAAGELPVPEQLQKDERANNDGEVEPDAPEYTEPTAEQPTGDPVPLQMHHLGLTGIYEKSSDRGHYYAAQGKVCQKHQRILLCLVKPDGTVSDWRCEDKLHPCKLGGPVQQASGQ